jgi:hypothetical protein
VCARKYKKSVTKPTCETRRTQTKIRITRRAGMPEPGSFFLTDFGLIGALGPPLFETGADAGVAANVVVGLVARFDGLRI